MDISPIVEFADPVDGSAEAVTIVDAGTLTEELQARIALWEQAIQDRDEALVRQVLAPGFALVMVEPVRSVMARNEWLEVLPDYVVHEWAVEEQIVDVDGDVAAVFERVRMRATVMGEDRSGVYVLSDLWRREGGEWLVWRRQSTSLSPGRLSRTE